MLKPTSRADDTYGNLERSSTTRSDLEGRMSAEGQTTMHADGDFRGRLTVIPEDLDGWCLAYDIRRWHSFNARTDRAVVSRSRSDDRWLFAFIQWPRGVRRRHESARS